MKIIKRSGSENEFDAEKIIAAISKANTEVPTIERLSEKQIKRLIERYHHNKTIEEIAHLEGVTRGSVNESIQAALAKLRENCEVFA